MMRGHFEAGILRKPCGFFAFKHPDELVLLWVLAVDLEVGWCDLVADTVY